MKAASLLLSLFLAAGVAQSPATWTPEFSLQVQNVSAVMPSPDGQLVAYTGYEAPPELEKAKKEKRDFRNIDVDTENHALYIVPSETDLNGKRAQRKLFDAKYHVASFDWSADSRSIAFEHWPSPFADN